MSTVVWYIKYVVVSHTILNYDDDDDDKIYILVFSKNILIKIYKMIEVMIDDIILY